MTTVTVTGLNLSAQQALFPERFRWCRAGILNVHKFTDIEFEFDGGMLVLRGPNGSGKTRALDMLFPFLLTGDRRRMGSGNGSPVTVESLMKVMSAGATNRVGYVWAECRTFAGEYRTVGAFFRYSSNTSQAKVAYFLTPLRVGIDLHLMDQHRQPLPRQALGEVLGARQLTDSAAEHRARVAQELFGLTDTRGRMRMDAAVELLYKLRSPLFGAKPEAADVVRLLTEALPPLPDDTLRTAGHQLDDLKDTRDRQSDIEEAAKHAADTLEVYRGYAATVISAEAAKLAEVSDAAQALQAAEDSARAHEETAGSNLRDAKTAAASAKDRIDELSSRKGALESSPAYKDFLGLVDRRNAADALKSAAAAELSKWWTLWGNIESAVGRASATAGSVGDAAKQLAATVNDAAAAATAAGTPHSLPAVAVAIGGEPGEPVSTRRTVDDDRSEMVHAPFPTIRVSPADLSDVTSAAGLLRDAATERAAAAHTRLETAKQLASDEIAVERAEEAATTARAGADTAKKEAESAAERRATVRVKLAENWVRWVRSDETSELLAGTDWDATPLRSLLAGDGLPDLSSLDGAAGGVSSDAFAAIAVNTGSVAGKLAAVAEEENLLTGEQTDLTSKKDQPPTAPAWVTVQGGVPFWRAVDFVPGTPANIQAAVESALSASGILTGAVTADGVSPAPGELIVSAAGTPASRSLADLLSVDTHSDASVAAGRILKRIGFNDPNHPVNVNADGSWNVGVTAGKPATVDEARYIGAAAQERARQARLRQITERLLELAGIHDELQTEAGELAERKERIGVNIAAAPSSSHAYQADSDEKSAATAADRAWQASNTANDAALTARSAWDERASTHRRACEHSGLPTGVADLRKAATLFGGTVDACRKVDTAATALDRQVAQFRSTALEINAAVDAASGTHTSAEAAVTDWRVAAIAVRELEAVAGTDAANVAAEITTVTKDLRDTTAEKEGWDSKVIQFTGTHSSAVTTTENAATVSEAAASLAQSALHAVAAVLQLPGFTAAATGTPDPAPTGSDITPDALIEWVAASVPKYRPVSIDTVHLSVDSLRAHVTQMFEVIRRTDRDVLLVDLINGEGSHPLAIATADLAVRAETGRQALMDAEYELFSNFIIEGVAADIRRTIALAASTVKETSGRVSKFRTSNGIGVRLLFSANGNVSDDIARIRELVSIADEVRTVNQNKELSTLLRRAVEEAYNQNRAEGYGKALNDCLDYRTWYTVDPVVLGPGESQERSLKGAKLSTGELRYVSLLTLICALDSHLTALPGTTPRLLLLDDAFIAIDENGRRILMSILVDRDIDVVMTGFDLWLHYPEISSLDEFDIVATGDESPTTSVRHHWDGHKRHLRAV